MIVVRYINPASHENVIADGDTLDRRKVHTIRKADVVTNLDPGRKALRCIIGNRLDPEIALRADASTENNVTSPNNPAAWTKIEARRIQRKGHKGTFESNPQAFDDQPGGDCKGIRGVKICDCRSSRLSHCAVHSVRTTVNHDT
jgi:hypothetical protein